MYQSTGNKPVPLIPLGNGRRIEDQIINNFLAAECTDGHDAGNDDDDECD